MAREALDPQALDPRTLDPRGSRSPDSRPPDSRPPECTVPDPKSVAWEPLDPQTLDPQTLDLNNVWTLLNKLLKTWRCPFHIAKHITFEKKHDRCDRVFFQKWCVLRYKMNLVIFSRICSTHGPRCPNMPHHRPPRGPKWSPRRLQHRPNLAPTWPHLGPTWPQVRPNGPPLGIFRVGPLGGHTRIS